jgi:hypothetical protein
LAGFKDRHVTEILNAQDLYGRLEWLRWLFRLYYQSPDEQLDDEYFPPAEPDAAVQLAELQAQLVNESMTDEQRAGVEFAIAIVKESVASGNQDAYGDERADDEASASFERISQNFLVVAALAEAKDDDYLLNAKD